MPSTRFENYLWFASVLLCAISLVLVAAMALFCYYKIIWVILSSSSKLAKLKRTADKQKVRSFERKLYFILGFEFWVALLIIPDCVFLAATFSSSLGIIAAIGCLHLLEIIRHGIATIDEKDEFFVVELPSVPQPYESESDLEDWAPSREAAKTVQ